MGVETIPRGNSNVMFVIAKTNLSIVPSSSVPLADLSIPVLLV